MKVTTKADAAEEAEAVGAEEVAAVAEEVAVAAAEEDHQVQAVGVSLRWIQKNAEGLQLWVAGHLMRMITRAAAEAEEVEAVVDVPEAVAEEEAAAADVAEAVLHPVAVSPQWTLKNAGELQAWAAGPRTAEAIAGAVEAATAEEVAAVAEEVEAVAEGVEAVAEGAGVPALQEAVAGNSKK